MSKGKSRGKIDCKEILDGALFIGSAKASKNLDGLKQMQITHIVCLAGKEWFPGEFSYLTSHFPDDPNVNILEKLPEILSFIDAAIGKNGKVLVHCMGGMSRSPTVVVAYLMHSQKMELNQAVEFVQQKRPATRLKPGFLQQLKYLHSIHSEEGEEEKSESI